VTTAIVLTVFALVFLALVVYGRLKFRHATLATLVPLPGEEVRFEDDAARFAVMPFVHAAITSLAFQRAVVRVTSRRIVVAQPALLAPAQRVIRFAIFTSPVPADLGDPLQDGYVTFSTTPDRVSAADHRGRRVLKIVPSDPGPPAPQFLLLDTPRLGEYLAVSCGERRGSPE
jgi:hypothetical protein